MKAAESRIEASPADKSACTENGDCTNVKVEMMTRQMLSAVSSGKMPLCRLTRRRIISASRAGRKAEPVSWLCLTAISRSMISPRSIRSWCIAFIDPVDLLAQIVQRGRLRGLRHGGIDKWAKS